MSIPYGKYDAYQVLEGSGGGGIPGQTAIQAGSGGGTIWLQANLLAMNQGQIMANGGIINEAAESGVGAGAGGTIFIGVNSLTGAGLIQANGGDASAQLGGGGSGGRVKIYFFNWFDPK